MRSGPRLLVLGLLGAALPAVALPDAPPAAAAPAIRLREVAASWGVTFRHHNAATGRRFLVETMVGGVVVFDYDGDGDEDLFFVDGGALPGYAGEAPRSRLYRNEGPGRFRDVTESAGIRVAGYGCGAVAGDVDGDGDLDLFVSELDGGQLFRNDGDGTFADVTAGAGLVLAGWSAGAAFGDVDRDGDLDLYLARYVDFTPATHRDCREPSSNLVGYCKPQAYRALPDRFFRNRGDGRFEEAGAPAGLAVATAQPGLGASFGDLDGDGWPDLFVANDGGPNFLFHNRGDGTFEEVAALAGAALSPAAKPEAGMGIDLEDYDGDGRLDVVVTNFDLEGLALYHNLGDLLFEDARFVARLAEPSLPWLGFGIDFLDLDQDRDLDLMVANGHVNDIVGELRAGAQFAQRNQVYENRGDATFREVRDSGVDLLRVHRGLASGDLDGDGDLDVAILATDAMAELWENVGAAGGFALVDLRGRGGNGYGVGARVTVEAGGSRQVREVRTATSYLSQNAMAVHAGLGSATSIQRLTVRWPDGRSQAWSGLPANVRLQIVAADR